MAADAGVMSDKYFLDAIEGKISIIQVVWDVASNENYFSITGATT